MRRWITAPLFVIATACAGGDIAPLPSPNQPGGGQEDPTGAPDDDFDDEDAGDVIEPDGDVTEPEPGETSGDGDPGDSR